MTDPTPTPQAPPQGLTDEQLLELAAREIEPYDRILPGEYEAEYQRALEVYGSELIAVMRAAIAADSAARPQPPPRRGGGAMSERKIMQLLLDSSSERCNYLYGLCSDGTILGFNDIVNGEWRVLPPIPQPLQGREVES